MKYTRGFAALCIVSLAACSSGTVKQTLGLRSGGPDEYRVVSRPPLSVPPQFNLRPPSTSDESPISVPASKQAQAMVTGNGPDSASTNTFSLQSGSSDTVITPVAASPLKSTGTPDKPAEAQFLKNAGAGQADPKIRENLMEQRVAAEEKSYSWWDIFHTDTPKKDPLVNAKGESDRIKTNQDEGKPVTEGDTPEVKDKDTGLLGRIFGY